MDHRFHSLLTIFCIIFGLHFVFFSGYILHWSTVFIHFGLGFALRCVDTDDVGYHEVARVWHEAISCPIVTAPRVGRGRSVPSRASPVPGRNVLKIRRGVARMHGFRATPRWPGAARYGTVLARGGHGGVAAHARVGIQPATMG